jgi:serine/threonine protein kinase
LRSKSGEYKDSGLNTEVAVYTVLKKEKGLPSIVDYFTQGSSNYLLIQLLPESLDKKLCCYLPTIKTVIYIAYQLLESLQGLYPNGFVHSDLKPTNIIALENSSNKSFLISDFGQLQKFIGKDGSSRIKSIDNVRIRGTLYYASSLNSPKSIYHGNPKK